MVVNVFSHYHACIAFAYLSQSLVVKHACSFTRNGRKDGKETCSSYFFPLRISETEHNIAEMSQEKNCNVSHLTFYSNICSQYTYIIHSYYIQVIFFLQKVMWASEKITYIQNTHKSSMYPRLLISVLLYFFSWNNERLEMYSGSQPEW